MGCSMRVTGRNAPYPRDMLGKRYRATLTARKGSEFGELDCLEAILRRAAKLVLYADWTLGL